MLHEAFFEAYWGWRSERGDAVGGSTSPNSWPGSGHCPFDTVTRVFRKRRHRVPQPPELEDGRWWEPTPSTTDEFLHQVGLDVLSGTGPDQLAAWLDGPTVLNWRESHVLRLRLGLDRGGAPRSVPEITRELGVAESRIHQIEAAALAKLRQHHGRFSSR